jgi:phospholipid/cholesterol/gamma-HCH transport system substrate-binding protein
MNANREKAVVGLFVLVAAGLLSATILAVSGGLGASRVHYRAYFKFAGGMQPGALVRYAGLTVGKVERVRVDPGNPARVEVAVQVDGDAPIKTDSVAKITALGALSENYLEVSPGSASAPKAPPGSVLNSTESFGFAQIGDAVQELLPDMKQAVQRLNQDLGGLQTTVARVNDVLNDRNRSNIGNSLGHANQILADAQPKVENSLTNVNQLSNKLVPLVDDLKKTTADADGTLKNLDAVLGENRSDVRASVTQLRGTLVKTGVLLDHLNDTADQNGDNIDQVLENLRLATENLRVLTDTLKANPTILIRGVKIEDRKPGGERK